MTSQPSGPNPYESDPYAPDGGGAPSQRPNPYAAQSHDSYYRPAADRYERRPERRRSWMWIVGIALTVVGMGMFFYVFVNMGRGDVHASFAIFPLAFIGIALSGLGGWLRKKS